MRRRWLGVLVLGLLLVGVAAWLTFFLARHGLAWSSEFSGIASFALAALVALLTAAGRLGIWLPAPRVRADQIAADISDLAAVLREQGRTKAALPGVSLYDRLPMRVRWESAGAGPGGESSGTFHDVIEFFTELPDQRLVVLGEAGAGKSVLVTELARSLLAHRDSEDPVPVIFSMVSWDPTQTPLFYWMSEQLTRVNPDLGQKVRDGRQIVTRAQVLVDRLKVLPVLDGLDEIGWGHGFSRRRRWPIPVRAIGCWIPGSGGTVPPVPIQYAPGLAGVPDRPIPRRWRTPPRGLRGMPAGGRRALRGPTAVM